MIPTDADSVRSIWEPVEDNDARVIGVPEGEQDIENLFEGRMTEKVPNLAKEIGVHAQKV